MTERLYYTDSMAASFEATVVACDVLPDGRAEVRLDRTAFYPTSGGQPFDTGALGGARVIDVVDREDGDVAHITASPLAVGQRVHGDIDWPRRFDHMQQHTGQHILSAAFEGRARARTVSFHLGEDTATIDLAREVTPAEIVEAEDAANDAIWADRAVVVRFATEEEASRLPLRKEPTRTGMLRLVEVTGCDLSACGGTHVPSAGMIGMIAVSGWERFKGGSRITFVCGGRALRAYRQVRDVTTAATRLLSVAAGDVAATIGRLQDDGKAVGRAMRVLQEENAGYRAASLRSAAQTIGGLRVVLQEERGWDGAALKALAAAIVREPGYVAVLIGDGQPAPIVAARSTDVAWDAGAWVKRATTELGGRGGGRPELAQAGLTVSAERVLAWARDSIGRHES